VAPRWRTRQSASRARPTTSWLGEPEASATKPVPQASRSRSVGSTSPPRASPGARYDETSRGWGGLRGAARGSCPARVYAAGTVESLPEEARRPRMVGAEYRAEGRDVKHGRAPLADPDIGSGRPA